MKNTPFNYPYDFHIRITLPIPYIKNLKLQKTTPIRLTINRTQCSNPEIVPDLNKLTFDKHSIHNFKCSQAYSMSLNPYQILL